MVNVRVPYVVLWAITWFANRALRGKRTFLRDPSDLSG
jgi:hypothetical protein